VKVVPRPAKKGAIKKLPSVINLTGDFFTEDKG
jgi:hypothetical protein